MRVKQDIELVEKIFSELRESRRKSDEKAADIAHQIDKLSIYREISSKLQWLLIRLKMRMLVLGLYNKAIKKRLYAITDSVYKAAELLEEGFDILKKGAKGEDETLLEFRITINQLERKLRHLDSEILDKAKDLRDGKGRPLYREVGAMIAVRSIATLLVLLEKQTESAALLLEKLVKHAEHFHEDNKSSPLHHRNRHRPTNKYFPL